MESARARDTSGERRVRVVHDRVPGRLRLAADLAAAPADLEAALLDVAGVRAASVRPLTGSIVLAVDPERPAASILEGVARCLETGKAPPAPRAAAAPAEGGAPPWHAKGRAAVAEALETSPERGLGAAEARRRLAVHGENRVTVERGEGPFVRLARQFQSAPVLMLAASAAASIATGGTADAVATLAVIAVNGTIGFVTEGQAEHTIAALMDTSGRTVTVVRDGAAVTIPAADLVPGDLVRLEAGHEIAADGRIVAAEDMTVDESPLTGESLPVPKDPDAAVPPDAPVGARPTMAHAATLVAEGTGLALVTATGRHTEAARIQHLSTTTRRPPARIETELDRLGGQLAGASLAACGVFLALGWLRGYPLPVILRDALALAVAAVPEGLPAVATSTLSLGIRGLERRGILVRKLAAVEQLGAVGVVCLDKTGTLTQNRMAVTETVTGLAGSADAAALAEVAALASAALAGGPAVSGTERALLAMARAAGADAEALAAARPRRLTLPRRAGRPMMATAHDGPEPLLAVKGAPETVLARCACILEDGTARPLADDDRARLLALNDRLAARPARVIAFARRRLDAVPISNKQHDLPGK